MDKLLKEIRANDIEAIRDRIKEGDDSIEGRPIFHIAVEEENIDLVRRMIEEMDVDVDCIDEKSQTALHVASRINNPDMIKLLIDNDIAYGVDEKENTPLHYAAIAGHADSIESLLTHDNVSIESLLTHDNLEDSFDRKNMAGNTPIMLAAQSGCTEGVTLLLEHSDVTIANDRGETAYSIAKGEARGIIDDYIQDQIESPGQSFHDAAREGHAYVIEDYLNKGGDINANKGGETALHTAITSGQEAVTEQLCRHGANIRIRDEANALPIDRSDNEAIREYLTERQEELNEQLLDALDQKLDKHAIQSLLDLGADSNAKDVNDTTVLHKVVIAGNAEIVQLLLNRPGVDINAQNNSGSTPLHCAVTLGNLELVKVLSNHPTVDLSLVDRVGLTAVEAAGVEGKNDIVEALFDAGSDPVHFKNIMAEQILQGRKIKRAYDPDMSLHNAALLLAAKTGNAKVLGKLIRVEGVNINATNEHGLNAVQLALGNGHVDIAKGLLAHGAKVDKKTAKQFVKAIGGKKMAGKNKYGIPGVIDRVLTVVRKPFRKKTTSPLSVIPEQPDHPLHSDFLESKGPEYSDLSGVSEDKAEPNLSDNIGKKPSNLGK